MSTWRIVRRSGTTGDWAGGVRVRDDGRVILESGAPMTDGRLAVMIWRIVADEHVQHTAGGSPFYDGPGGYHGYLRAFEGRYYAHSNDEGGIADAMFGYDADRFPALMQ